MRIYVDAESWSIYYNTPQKPFTICSEVSGQLFPIFCVLQCSCIMQTLICSVCRMQRNQRIVLDIYILYPYKSSSASSSGRFFIIVSALNNVHIAFQTLCNSSSYSSCIAICRIAKQHKLRRCS